MGNTTALLTNLMMTVKEKYGDAFLHKTKQDKVNNQNNLNSHNSYDKTDGSVKQRTNEKRHIIYSTQQSWYQEAHPWLVSLEVNV